MEHSIENARLAQLAAPDLERVRRALATAFSASTRRAYLGHWKAFRAWAGERGYDCEPASPETVAAHLATLAETAGVSALKVRRAAIGAVHRAAGLPDPAASELVKRALGGLTRRADATSRQAAPLTADALAAIRSTALRRRTSRRGYRELRITLKSLELTNYG